jgi:hypothetical protein
VYNDHRLQSAVVVGLPVSPKKAALNHRLSLPKKTAIILLKIFEICGGLRQEILAPE